MTITQEDTDGGAPVTTLYGRLIDQTALSGSGGSGLLACERTLGDIFCEAGNATLCTGKWYIGDGDVKRAARLQFPVSYRTGPDPYPGMWRGFFRQFVVGIPHLWPFQRVARRTSATYKTRPITLTGFMSNHEALNIVFTSRYFQPNAKEFDESFAFVGPSTAPHDETIDFPLDFSANCTGPLVYISLGTTIIAANVAFYRACFRAFGDTNERVILSTGQWTDSESLANAPPNFIIRPYVPQLEILKLADVLITHGGMGSVSEGLVQGVPLIVVPQTADQPFVAQRVRRLGAGHVRPHREPHSQAVVQLLPGQFGLGSFWLRKTVADASEGKTN